MQSENSRSFRFRERFTEVLRGRGVTQGQLAEATGISPAALSNYLRGARSVPRVEELATLARYFAVSMEWLLGIEEPSDGQISPLAADAPVPLDRRKLRAVSKQMRRQVDRLDELCGERPTEES